MMEYELLRGPLVELDGRLGLNGGIFYLHCDEIRPVVDGLPMRDTIDERRRQHRLHQQLRPPQVIIGDRLPERAARRPRLDKGEDASGLLKGIGVSPGAARGPVRILSSAADLSNVQNGEILVVPSLDPTWTTAYARAAGLIAERGAMLSHGAILAREFAVPAIVNVADAISLLNGSEKVELDGATGEIRVLR